MSNFVKSLDELATTKSVEIAKNSLKDVTKTEDILAQINKLAIVKLPVICNTCAKKANIGRRECHINFDACEFSICGLTYRQGVQLMMDIVTAPGEKLEGINYEIWGNSKNTIHFMW